MAQSTRKLLNRINRAIRDCKRNGRRGLSQLLKHKHQVIESLRVEKHQRQRKANDDSFAADPYAAYNRVINPPDPTAPQGTKKMLKRSCAQSSLQAPTTMTTAISKYPLTHPLQAEK